jgi:hypothetical protein
MIIFEDELLRLVEILPNVTVGSQSTNVKFNWGTEEVLTKYLTMNGIESFPLIWLVEGVDTNNEREPSVTRNAKIIILHMSQAPNEFNQYQHEYDFKLILQPILDNLIKALDRSGISRYDNTNFKTQRVKNFSMKEVNESLVYVCNAIVFESEITFSGLSSCINTINFNN